MLRGKKILLGISGSIAAYKAAMLTRLFVKQEAEVKVIMTDTAKSFITPLTLSTLSKNPVYSTFEKDDTGIWNNHVELGLWADVLIIAPASANTIAKMAHGICDNLLLATYLSAKCPVFVAPAMDLDMYVHPSNRSNLEQLTSYGNKLIDAGHGELASGLMGQGRLAEPEEIIEKIDTYFSSQEGLQGKQVMITAGPTYEAIDPVRFIGNHSSGKMGYALAEAAAMQGATVILVSGPTSMKIKHPNVIIKPVTTAQEMYDACKDTFPNSDISIMAAAVADYSPEHVHQQKIKKKGDTYQIAMVKTKDIAAELGKIKKEGQITVGFALETENELQNANKKLLSKNFDMIVLNSLNDNGAGFGHDTNKITLIDKDNNTAVFELKDKVQVAKDIIDAIILRTHA